MAAVVINEFEVVTEPAPQAEPSSSAPAEGEAQPPPGPQEIAAVMRRQAERLARVRAH